jgi:DeoR/GlpR family transcriptional regulator of sugar metabolism
MLAIERHNAIKEMLQQQDCVSITELSKQFGVTEETIRRDLEKLSAADKNIDRVHGGAYLIKNADLEAPFEMRKEMLVEEKRSIAMLAAKYIESGDCIMLDSSTTALQLAVLLKETTQQLTVISNSISVVNEFSMSKNIRVICIGGSLRHNSQSFVGYAATQALSEYRANKAFVSCSGIHQTLGITDNSEGEAQVRRLMLTNAARRIMLVDSEKFGRSAFHQIAPMDSIHTIITDMEPELPWRDLLREKRIELVCASAKE